MPRKRKPDTGPEDGRSVALRLLARREHSAAELRYKLERRGHETERVEQVVGELAEAGWQSDARYAEMLVRNRVEQGYGPLRIRAELEAARIPDAEIRAALDAAEVDWRAQAGAVHARRFRTAPQGAADWQKQYRFLAQRGFEPEQIRAALKRGPEDID